MKKIQIPFTNKKAGNNKTFKIMDNKEINKSLFTFIKKLLSTNTNKNKNHTNKDTVKIDFIKGSTTKKYYNKLSV